MAMDVLLGKKLGPYEIREKIGRGGMATVFKAYQPSLDRFVALKVLAPVLADAPGFTERFQREARAVANLHHPNILQIHDFGTQDDYHYIVMRYVEGAVTLEKLMTQGKPIEKLIDYTIQVADALNYAHEQGIIHRDVKPSNVLIDGEWALLADFGLVKDRRRASRLTALGRGIGTPAYMSPEQASGSEVDHRTDIYALGVILYEILTGSIPHDAPTPTAIVAKRITEPVPSIRQVKPDVSESLERVTLQALARERQHRFNTATQFAASLRQAKENPHYHDNPDRATQYLSGITPEAKSNRTKNLRTLISWGIAAVAAAILLLLVAQLFISDYGQSVTQPTTPASIAGDMEASSLTTATIPPTEMPASPTATPASMLAETPVAVTKTDLAVWSGPGNNYELLGYLPAGAQTEITSRNQAGTWWRIRTGLSLTGAGWIEANDDVDVAHTASLPIAVPPPTFTPLPTATSKPPAFTPEPSATTTATPTETIARTTLTTPVPASPTVSSTAPLPTGELRVLKPISTEIPSYGLTEFEWQWTGVLAENQGFEVRVWRDGEPPTGVHNAVLDNKEGNIQALGNDTYRLVVDITETPGVRGTRGEYNWTVVLIQIEPEYKDLGLQAQPGRLRFEPPGGGGGGSDDNFGGGGSFN